MQQLLDLWERQAFEETKDDIIMSLQESDLRLPKEQLRQKIRQMIHDYLEEDGLLISIDDEPVIERLTQEILDELQEAV